MLHESKASGSQELLQPFVRYSQTYGCARWHPQAQRRGGEGRCVPWCTHTNGHSRHPYCRRGATPRILRRRRCWARRGPNTGSRKRHSCRSRRKPSTGSCPRCRLPGPQRAGHAARGGGLAGRRGVVQVLAGEAAPATTVHAPCMRAPSQCLCTGSQGAVNRCFEPPEFTLHERYAYVLKVAASVLVFAPAAVRTGLEHRAPSRACPCPRAPSHAWARVCAWHDAHRWMPGAPLVIDGHRLLARLW